MCIILIVTLIASVWSQIIWVVNWFIVNHLLTFFYFIMKFSFMTRSTKNTKSRWQLLRILFLLIVFLSCKYQCHINLRKLTFDWLATFVRKQSKGLSVRNITVAEWGFLFMLSEALNGLQTDSTLQPISLQSIYFLYDLYAVICHFCVFLYCLQQMNWRFSLFEIFSLDFRFVNENKNRISNPIIVWRY